MRPNAPVRIVIYLVYLVILFGIGSPLVQFTSGTLSLILYLFQPDRRMRSGSLYILFFLIAAYLGELANYGWTIDASTGLIETIRLFSMIIGAKYLVIRTPVPELIDGLGVLLGPLRRLRIPIDDLIEIMRLTASALDGLRKKITDELNSLKYNDMGTYNRVVAIAGALLPFLICALKSPQVMLEGRDGVESVESNIVGRMDV